MENLTIKKKRAIILLSVGLLVFGSCSQESGKNIAENKQDSVKVEEAKEVKISLDDIKIEKDFLYNQHTLEDSYPYKDTARMFQWDKIKEKLFFLDSVQIVHKSWGILQNYKNKNREAPLIKEYKRNEYKRVADMFGVERYQSVPLFAPNDTTIGERYGRDGSLVKFIEDKGNFIKVETIDFPGEWLVPKRYVKTVSDSVNFTKVIVVDVTNQNIATLEKVDDKWLVRSMNPATTGLHRPPYQQETPLGIFVVQEKKPKMLFLKDGTTLTGGYAPNASRFTNGGYIHGVPVNLPSTKPVEFSPSLGTTPRSHMCVRNATSHAKFVYDWAPAEQSIVVVIK